MITQTSELAIKALIYIAQLQPEGAPAVAPRPVTPREAAEAMGASPTYMAKVLGLLSKARLLESHRGAQGGMTLARDPERITMLEIVEACQGLLVGNYCQAIGDRRGPVCGFHDAMLDVHDATVQALRRWTLAQLVAKPEPTGPLKGNAQCRMAFLCGLAPKPPGK